MNPANLKLIDQLSEDLTPVRTMKFRDGMLMAITALVASVLIVAFVNGLWQAGLAGQASPYFYITNALLLAVGFAGATSVITMASPRVGNRHDGPRWAMAMLGVLPVVGVITLLAQGGGDHAQAIPGDPHALKCALSGMAAGTLTAFVLFAWLRRGAPVSPNATGLHLGVAAGALGSAAYGLSCPIDGVLHLGFWHVAPVLILGLAGRFIVPRLLRW